MLVPCHEWLDSIQRWEVFRSLIEEQFGLRVRTEIHSSELIRVNKLSEYKSITKTDRISILARFVLEIPNIFNDSKLINICFDKSQANSSVRDNIAITAYDRLFNRLDTYLKKSNGYCTIFCDGTIDNPTKNLLRRMRVYNPIPSMRGGTYQNLITRILEDIIFQ